MPRARLRRRCEDRRPRITTPARPPRGGQPIRGHLWGGLALVAGLIAGGGPILSGSSADQGLSLSLRRGPAPALAQAIPPTPQPETRLPADFRPFDPRSPWNTPIPAGATPDPDSPAMIARLLREAGPLRVGYARWSIPLYVVDSDRVLLKTVVFSKPSNPRLDPAGAGWVAGVPIPDGARADAADDGHLLIVDPKRMLSWDLARATQISDTAWEASRLDVWDLTGMGLRRPFAGKTWWSYGARGSGFPLIAGLIRPEEIAAGRIRHALVFDAPTTRKSRTPGGPLELCPPASRTDGQSVGPDTLPMGVRLRLDPTVDITGLGLSPAMTVVAQALQEYGMILGDSTVNTWKLYFQNLSPEDPTWQTLGLDTIDRLPLHRFQVLPCPIATKVIP